MRVLSRIIDIILYIIAIIVVTAAIGASVTKKPVFMTSVRSNSMYPLFQRGDMLIIKSVTPKDEVNDGDIIIFKVEEGSLSSKGWIVHRIVSGNYEEGFITKGDANEYTDQESGGTGPIRPEWIASRVVTIDYKPVKIPLLGYLPLWMEGFQKNPYLFPIIVGILAIVIGAGELFGNKKKGKKSRSKLDMQLIYLLCGITFSIILAVSTVTSSQHLSVVYEVSDSSKGILSGSDVGILKTGEVIERPLASLNTKGVFPFVVTITTNDPQITASNHLTLLKPKEELKTTFKVNAIVQGKYESKIHIGMFLPVLPSKFIYWLAAKSYWLALIITSIIPGLPFMLYPLIDSNLRRKTLKEIRRKFRRIRNAFSV